ncbi:hypothetical protein B566_EDAN019052, partial [Ephemera danica]
MHHRAFFARQGVVAQHLVTVLVRNQRADVQAARLLGQGLHEAFEDRPLHIHAFRAQAHLAGIGETGTGHAGHGGIEIGIFKHHRGVLATELEADLSHAFGCGLHDGAASARFTGEGDGVQPRMAGEKFARGIGAETMQQVEHAGRHAGLMHHLGQQGGRRRRFFRRLDHHRVAAGQGRRHLPGRDDAHHAQRLAHGVVQQFAAIVQVGVELLAMRQLDDVGKGAEVGHAAHHGDETRGWGPPFDAQGTASYFHGLNRNKRGTTLDFNDPAQREQLMGLLAGADVLLENFKTGSMEKWGMGFATLHERFPRLVHCRVSGFGADGPLGGLPGYDAAIQAMAGIMSVNGEAGGQPLRVGVPLVDIVTGLNAALGVMLALQARHRTGLGQFGCAIAGQPGMRGVFGHVLRRQRLHRAQGTVVNALRQRQFALRAGVGAIAEVQPRAGPQGVQAEIGANSQKQPQIALHRRFVHPGLQGFGAVQCGHFFQRRG